MCLHTQYEIMYAEVCLHNYSYVRTSGGCLDQANTIRKGEFLLYAHGTHGDGEKDQQNIDRGGYWIFGIILVLAIYI